MPLTLPEWLLVIGAVAINAWIFLPFVFALVGLSRIGCEITGGPSDVSPDGSDPLFEDAHRQLLSLGFEPQGTYREWTRFETGHWFWWSVGEYVYASRRQQCFAIAYRLKHGPIQVGMRTRFEDDTLVFTTTSDISVETFEGFLRNHVESRNLRELLDRHRETVERLQDQGKRVVEDFSLAAARDANVLEHDKLVARGFFRDINLSMLINYLTLFATVALISFAMLPRNPNPIVFGSSMALVAGAITELILTWSRWQTRYGLHRQSVQLRQELEKSGVSHESF